MRISPNLQVLFTGCFAWLILSFAILKLAVIYTSHPRWAYLIAYNISGLIYLIYFYSYFKNRFDFKMLLLLIVIYDFGIYGLELIYREAILVQKRIYLLWIPPIIIVSAIGNLLVSCLAYLIIRKLRARKK